MSNFKNTFNSILEKNDNIFIYLDQQDVHIMIMANASNLLLHKGGFSAIGSIVSTGQLFITHLFTHNFHPIWKKLVNKPCEMLD
jgi:UDP-N-acetylenolpyruvoylglucosamine reductase